MRLRPKQTYRANVKTSGKYMDRENRFLVFSITIVSVLRQVSVDEFVDLGINFDLLEVDRREAVLFGEHPSQLVFTHEPKLD